MYECFFSNYFSGTFRIHRDLPIEMELITCLMLLEATNAELEEILARVGDGEVLKNSVGDKHTAALLDVIKLTGFYFNLHQRAEQKLINLILDIKKETHGISKSVHIGSKCNQIERIKTSHCSGAQPPPNTSEVLLPVIEGFESYLLALMDDIIESIQGENHHAPR